MQSPKKGIVAFVVCTGVGSFLAAMALNLTKPATASAQTPVTKADVAPKPKIVTETTVTKVKADPPVEWTAVESDPGLTVLKVATKSRWILVDDTGAVLRASEDGLTATFAAATSGKYRILVISDTVVERISVCVGNVPMPLPPVDPVKPLSDLGKKFQAAYALDTRDLSKKQFDIGELKELYTQAGKMCADPKVASTGQLLDQVKAASSTLVVSGLTDLRKAIAAELSSSVLAIDETLTPDLRASAAAAFVKIVASLNEVQ